jgi:type IV pilus assembly protein PilW
MNPSRTARRQTGVTLIELMVTMAITLFLVAAAAYVYLATRETQRAIDNNSANTEVGTFALQLIGEQIMMAGYYPANISRVLTTAETFPKITAYPPTAIVGNSASTVSDWAAPSTTPAGLYTAGIFGCDSAPFLPASGKCDDPVNGAGDSIVINYFTNDNLGTNAGHRLDCAGNNVDNDPSNVNRLNVANPAGPPLQPLFVSNRFTIRETYTEVEKQKVKTFSLACNGNGVPVATDTFQPILAGIEDLQITYGVFAAAAPSKSRTAEKFFTATEMSSLPSVAVETGLGGDLPILSPWARVSAVRLCIMTRSLGAGVKVSDKTNRTYVDCNGLSKTQGADDTNLHKRFVQVFVVRNKMNQVY